MQCLGVYVLFVMVQCKGRLLVHCTLATGALGQCTALVESNAVRAALVNYVGALQWCGALVPLEMPCCTYCL